MKNYKELCEQYTDPNPGAILKGFDKVLFYVNEQIKADNVTRRGQSGGKIFTFQQIRDGALKQPNNAKYLLDKLLERIKKYINGQFKNLGDIDNDPEGMKSEMYTDVLDKFSKAIIQNGLRFNNFPSPDDIMTLDDNGEYKYPEYYSNFRNQVDTRVNEGATVSTTITNYLSSIVKSVGNDLIDKTKRKRESFMFPNSGTYTQDIGLDSHRIPKDIQMPALDDLIDKNDDSVVNNGNVGLVDLENNIHELPQFLEEQGTSIDDINRRVGYRAMDVIDYMILNKTKSALRIKEGLNLNVSQQTLHNHINNTQFIDGINGYLGLLKEFTDWYKLGVEYETEDELYENKNNKKSILSEAVTKEINRIKQMMKSIL